MCTVVHIYYIYVYCAEWFFLPEKKIVLREALMGTLSKKKNKSERYIYAFICVFIYMFSCISVSKV